MGRGVGVDEKCVQPPPVRSSMGAGIPCDPKCAKGAPLGGGYL